MSDLTGETFKSSEVSDLYIHRPPYAADIYRCLVAQAPATTRLLDLGCGEGKIARPMGQAFDQVVAVDPSANMIALGKGLENGQAENITWIKATADEAALVGKFDVVTFASSIHWMDPALLFSKLRHHLNPDHLLAIISGDEAFEPPWDADWRAFLSKWVPEVSGRPFGSQEWQSTRDRHLAHMEVIDHRGFVSEKFEQSVESFILCQHSRNTFPISKLGARVDDFRRELREVLAPHQDMHGVLSYRVKTHLTLAKLDLAEA